MASIVFNYPKDKIEKLDELSTAEGRTRSGYIQIILMEFLNKKGIDIKPAFIKETEKPKKKVLKKKKEKTNG